MRALGTAALVVGLTLLLGGAANAQVTTEDEIRNEVESWLNDIAYYDEGTHGLRLREGANIGPYQEMLQGYLEMFAERGTDGRLHIRDWNALRPYADRIRQLFGPDGRLPRNLDLLRERIEGPARSQPLPGEDDPLPGEVPGGSQLFQQQLPDDAGPRIVLRDDEGNERVVTGEELRQFAIIGPNGEYRFERVQVPDVMRFRILQDPARIEERVRIFRDEEGGPGRRLRVFAFRDGEEGDDEEEGWEDEDEPGDEDEADDEDEDGDEDDDHGAAPDQRLRQMERRLRRIERFIREFAERGRDRDRDRESCPLLRLFGERFQGGEGRARDLLGRIEERMDSLRPEDLQRDMNALDDLDRVLEMLRPEEGGPPMSERIERARRILERARDEFSEMTPEQRDALSRRLRDTFGDVDPRDLQGADVERRLGEFLISPEGQDVQRRMLEFLSSDEGRDLRRQIEAYINSDRGRQTIERARELLERFQQRRNQDQDDEARERPGRPERPEQPRRPMY